MRQKPPEVVPKSANDYNGMKQIFISIQMAIRFESEMGLNLELEFGYF